MHHLGFTSCKADPDAWTRPAKKSDGSEYWEYVLLYTTDNALVASENSERFLREELERYFELKEESTGLPKIYLGSKMSKVVMENSTTAWLLSSSQYVQPAVKNVEDSLAKQNKKLPAHANTLLSSSDISIELQPVDVAYF